MFGKFRVRVAVFDWWLLKKSLFAGLRKIICSEYGSTKDMVDCCGL